MSDWSSDGCSSDLYAMGRAKRAIEALAELAPEKATVRRDGQTTELPVEELVVGDVVVVRPNERLPADGFVIKGSSANNQATVTGESIPVDKERSEEHTSELQSLMSNSYAVFCLKKKIHKQAPKYNPTTR